jgi:hypothetical protein
MMYWSTKAVRQSAGDDAPEAAGDAQKVLGGALTITSLTRFPRPFSLSVPSKPKDQAYKSESHRQSILAHGKTCKSHLNLCYTETYFHLFWRSLVNIVNP